MLHYTFSITYDDAVAKVKVLESCTLYELASVLLKSIGFDMDHSFGFHSDLKSPYAKNMKKQFTLFADNGDKSIESDTGVESTEVREAFHVGETLLFHFDYGDDWMFHVKCLAIESDSSKKKKPEILEVKGEFPEQYPEL